MPQPHIDIFSNNAPYMVHINQIFGGIQDHINERLAFVLMPFTDELTRIYSLIVKPIVGSKDLDCRRADDYKTITAIIQDIWRAICESRLVIADMTGLNPNVMYELGIAHAVGKDTYLILAWFTIFRFGDVFKRIGFVLLMWM